MLPKTQAKTVEERISELVGKTNDKYLHINSYRAYNEFPEVKPFRGKPDNIRLYTDGVEFLVNCTTSDRIISIGDPNRGNIEASPMNTSYIFQLIDENRKRILEYSIDAQDGEY